MGMLNLKGIEFARKGGGNCKKEKKFEERPHNSHPCEFARNEIIQQVENWKLHGTEFAGN